MLVLGFSTLIHYDAKDPRLLKLLALHHYLLRLFGAIYSTAMIFFGFRSAKATREPNVKLHIYPVDESRFHGSGGIYMSRTKLDLLCSMNLCKVLSLGFFYLLLFKDFILIILP